MRSEFSVDLLCVTSTRRCQNRSLPIIRTATVLRVKVVLVESAILRVRVRVLFVPRSPTARWRGQFAKSIITGWRDMTRRK
jgi:hypothetical protein